ncbi:MAG TPA: CHAT domain-containing protein [Blastocatellia bacterium]|nr:CHAT domain-containing protein [Blastocatellia bacterium]
MEEYKRESQPNRRMRPEVTNGRPLLDFLAKSNFGQQLPMISASPLTRRAPGPRLRQILVELEKYGDSPSRRDALISALRSELFWRKILLGDDPSNKTEKTSADSEPSIRVADIRQDANYLVAVINVSGFITTNYLLLRFSSNQPEHVSYWHASTGGGSMDYGVRRLGPSEPDRYIFSRNSTTGHYLSLWLIDIASQTVLPFYEKDDLAYHGAFSFVDFDFDGNLELMLSYATDDRLYNSCNQCPSRRRAEIWKISPDLKQALLVGKHVSWGDLRTKTSPTLMGLGPEVRLTLHEPELQKRIREFATTTKTGNELEKYANEIINTVSIYVEARLFETAARVLLAIDRAISSHSDGRQLTNSRAHALTLAAYFQIRHGDLEAAEETLSKILASGLATSPENQDRIALIRFDLARSKGDLGGQYRALQNLKTETALKEDLPQRMAKYLIDVGDFSGVAALARRPKALQDPETRWHIATALAKLGHHQAALDHLLALAREAVTSSEGDHVSKVFLLAAEIGSSRGQFDLSRQLVDAAISHMHPDFWTTEAPLILSLYGTIRANQGEKAEARVLLETALRSAQQIGGVRLARPYDALAKIAEEMQQRDAARKASVASLRALAQSQTKVATEAHKLLFVESGDELAVSQIARLIRLQTRPEDVLAGIEVWRSQVLRSLARGRGGDYGSFVEFSNVLTEIRRRINENTSVVSYWVGGGSVYAFITQHNNIWMIKLPTTAADIEKLRVRVQRQLDLSDAAVESSISADVLPAGFTEDLEALYRVLIRPLELQAHIKNLVIVPDEQLYWIPWVALSPPSKSKDDIEHGSIKAGNSPLIMNYTIKILPSALLLEAEPARPPRSAVLIASTLGVSKESLKQFMPSWRDTNSKSNLPNLARTIREVSTIQELLQAQDIQISETLLIKKEQEADLLPEVITKRFTGADLIHIASHGLFDSFDGMASAMLLGGNNARGLLRAADLAALDLRNTSLLVLSGCQTGIVAVKAGQEPIGFVRAAIAAGVQSILLTQWAVDDLSTERWFLTLYARISRGMSIDQAYRETMIEMARRYRHPFYWAGVSLYSRK